MRKSLFVVLAILASAIPASAQSVRWGYIPQTPDGWFYKIQGDQVGMLTADNLGMVRNLTKQLRRSEIRSLRDDLRWNGSAYGISTGRGFYPMYDHNMRPMGRREATITGAAIGAGIGYAVSGNGRGTAIGAVGGAIVGLFTHRGKNNNQRNVIVTPPQDQDQQGVYVGSDRISIAIGSRSASATRPSRGEWRVSNRTSKRAELWDGEQFVERIEPWQRNVPVPVPSDPDGYKAILVYSDHKSGRIVQENAQIRGNSNFNGWDIVAPAVQ